MRTDGGRCFLNEIVFVSQNSFSKELKLVPLSCHYDGQQKLIIHPTLILLLFCCFRGTVKSTGLITISSSYRSLCHIATLRSLCIWRDVSYDLILKTNRFQDLTKINIAVVIWRVLFSLVATWSLPPIWWYHRTYLSRMRNHVTAIETGWKGIWALAIGFCIPSTTSPIQLCQGYGFPGRLLFAFYVLLYVWRSCTAKSKWDVSRHYNLGNQAIKFTNVNGSTLAMKLLLRNEIFV